MLLASLAQIIANYESQDFKEHPFVTFLSSSEMQLVPTPTNKLYSDNPLRKLINEKVEAYYKDEEKSWLELWTANHLYEVVTDINVIYNATYSPMHIYHSYVNLKYSLRQNNSFKLVLQTIG